MSAPATDRLLTTVEVCRALRISRATFYRWHAAGRLHTVRLPGGRLRVPLSEVARLLDAGQQVPQRAATAQRGEAEALLRNTASAPTSSPDQTGAAA